MAVQPIKAIGAAVANSRVGDFRRAAPPFCRHAVIADDEAGPVTDIDADRQKIQQAIGKVQNTLVQEGLKWNRGLYVADKARHGRTPTPRTSLLTLQASAIVTRRSLPIHFSI